ncbi:MAG: hypothetical protein NTU49_03510 [Gammaproteobacteria bacterium]|nr:hypothetical protein [Gammaproteobacteria bacterium]
MTKRAAIVSFDFSFLLPNLSMKNAFIAAALAVSAGISCYLYREFNNLDPDQPASLTETQVTQEDSTTPPNYCGNEEADEMTETGFFRAASTEKFSDRKTMSAPFVSDSYPSAVLNVVDSPENSECGSEDAEGFFRVKSKEKVVDDGDFVIVPHPVN